MTKEILDRPQTSYALTTKGRTAFQEYLTVLERDHQRQPAESMTMRLIHDLPLSSRYQPRIRTSGMRWSVAVRRFFRCAFKLCHTKQSTNPS